MIFRHSLWAKLYPSNKYTFVLETVKTRACFPTVWNFAQQKPNGNSETAR